MIELDHVFCFVDPDVCDRVSGLDDGIEHAGQGTRNRRLPLGEQYLELLWLTSRTDAERNSLRLDRRADWRTSGASPFGFGLRGQLAEAERADFRVYRPPYAPEVGIWIHRSNEEAPELPLLFVMEASGDALERMRARIRGGDGRRFAGVVIAGPVAPQPLLRSLGVTWVPAARPRLAVAIAGAGEVVEISEILTVTCELSDPRGNLARMDTMTQDETPTPETIEPVTQNARYAELLRLVTSMEQDFRKFFDQGNKAAGTRVRQAMQELKSFAQNVRTEVLAMRSGPKPE